MFASLFLYSLWLFMTGFMLAVVVAGGKNTRSRRLATARKETSSNARLVAKG